MPWVRESNNCYCYMKNKVSQPLEAINFHIAGIFVNKPPCAVKLVGTIRFPLHVCVLAIYPRSKIERHRFSAILLKRRCQIPGIP